MSSRRYDAVIFDMGGVLIGGIGNSFTKFEKENDLKLGSLFKTLFETGEKSIWAGWERGEFCYDEFKEKFEQEYLHLNGKSIVLKPVMNEWLPYTLVPQMIDKVKSLRSDGYKTALLTNNMFVTPGKSFQPIDSEIFDVIIESCKVGLRKPTEQIYLLCLEKLGVPANKTVFLDDIGINLKAANKIGITTIKVEEHDKAILELERVLNETDPSDTIPVSSSHLFDEHTLLTYLEEQRLVSIGDGCRNVVVRKFSHGQSNPTFYLKVNDQEFVLRKKPPGKILPSAHAIEREYAIMNAISKSVVPVPKMIHLCEDSGVIGTPFYLMEYINGTIYKDIALATSTRGERANIYSQVCDVLCQIHKMDSNHCGIEKKERVFDSRKEYLQRNINRWWKQYEFSKISDDHSMVDLHQWLLANIPNDTVTNQPCTLCHGDFRIDNIVFSKHDGIDQLSAVLDWELSSFGDPVTDLATLCFPYYMPNNFPLWKGLNFQTSLPDGIPTMSNLIMDYCNKMGIKEIANFIFYQCFVLFRLAAILTGVGKRAQTGQHSGQDAAALSKVASVLTELGISMAQEKERNQSDSMLKNSLGAMPLSIDNLRKEVRVMYHKIREIINDDIIPAEGILVEFYQDQNNANKVHPLMEKWKKNAKSQGLWNLFMPIDSDKSIKYGQGLTNLEYSFLCEQMGRSLFAPEVFNCSAPDTGNMEILAKYGTEQQKQEWLSPLLEGKMRSCFGMTEPAVASSDARNIRSEIRDGGNNEYVINGHKWWTSGALHPKCDLCIFMGKTDDSAPDHKQQSMILVPMKSPGVKIIRPLHVFGYSDSPGGHAEVTFTNVRVPKSNILIGEGQGFQIAQGRLGPGRVHHCMRLIGYAERSMELVMDRIDSRSTFGKKLSEHGMIQLSIAQSRIEIEQARLLVMKTAHMMDNYGNKKSKQEIAMIKVVVPNMAVNVIDRAIQCFGGAGFCEDYPLATMYTISRILRVADGPDEVHIQSIAQQMIRDHKMIKATKAQL